MTEPIISVRDVSVSYGTHRVLDRVSLEVRRGEVIVLLGASGSGKSTLLRQIIGLERPDSGTVCIKGVDINRCSEKALNSLRRSMGVAFQEAALFGSLTTKENVEMPLRELTSLADPVIDIMSYLKLATLGLGEAGQLLPEELSGGMKKRAAIARAAALDPEVLIFDEPSAGLDPIVAAELDELILFLKRLFEMTILVVTHEMASAFRIADRVAFLYHGSLIAVEDKQAFQANSDPRIRQFVDRVPTPIGESATVWQRMRKLAGLKEEANEEH
jgi:phospholipid/cholesterol/gamma-HCH transport system ATP-binding protein